MVSISVSSQITESDTYDVMGDLAQVNTQSFVSDQVYDPSGRFMGQYNSTGAVGGGQPVRRPHSGLQPGRRAYGFLAQGHAGLKPYGDGPHRKLLAGPLYGPGNAAIYFAVGLVAGSAWRLTKKGRPGGGAPRAALLNPGRTHS